MNVPAAVKFDIVANGKTPKELGYYFPAEFARQDAMWLSWPHK
jgi:agmatine/peptidylarginine deiminase